MAYKKDPSATLDYTFDWTAYLTPLGDVISTATFTLDTGLTKVSQTVTGMTATVFVSGGTAGQKLSVSCRITTLGGRTDERTIVLQIVNR